MQRTLFELIHDTFGEAPWAAHAVTWLALVKRWNEKIDLTAARDDAHLVDLALRDAWELAQALNAAPRIVTSSATVRVVDVGTGFGSPGLALAIVCPELDVTLVEPLGKRVSFLRTCIGTLGYSKRVRVEPTRGEAVAQSGASFDLAISRATLSPESWLSLAELLAKGGHVGVFLAKEELPPTNRPIVGEQSYQTGDGAARRLVLLGPPPE